MKLCRPWNQDRWAPRFFTIWGGQIFSLLGSHVVQFALVWWLTETTGSATVLAIGTMVALIPQIVLTPFAGALIDRWNRRKVMIIADGGIALATGLLAVLFALGIAEVWHIYALVFVRSIGGAFHWVTMQASTSMMVPEQHLTRVAGINQTLAGTVNIIAPPAAAFLLAVLPMQGILAIDVITASIAIVPLLFLQIPQPSRAEGVAERPRVFRDVADGLRFLWGRRGLLILVGIVTLLNLLATPAFSLLPIYVKDFFGGTAIDLGIMESAFGAGMIAGGVLLAAWGGAKRKMVACLLAIAAEGIGLLVLGLTPAWLFLGAVGALAGIGILNPIVNGSFMSMLQSSVPHDMQGRVFALVISGAQAMSPLGLAVAGPVADRFGIQLWFLLAGASSIVMGLGALLIPAILRADQPSPQPEGDAEAS